MTEEEREKARQARREYNKRYREKNREKINEYNRQWNKENRDKKAAIDRRYRKNNPEKLKATLERYWLKKAVLLDDQPAPQGVKCLHCGTTFTPKRSDAKFCGTSCRVMNNRKQKRQ